jgi:hypothetical protein
LRLSNFLLSVVCAGSVIAAADDSAGADYPLRKDYGGHRPVQAQVRAIRDPVTGDHRRRLQPACTLVLGTFAYRICVTPAPGLGFHGLYRH